MAKFSLQEMYLTEYNRLIAALQTYFTEGTSFTTIEQWADYLNSVKSSKEIKKVNLNNIIFASEETGTTTEYVQGTQSIELTKHNSLIAANVKKGVTIEGITGTLVDGSTIVKLSDIQSVLDSKILSSLEVGYNYWYYDDTAKELKSGAGKAQATQNNKELTLGTDLLYSSGIFSLSESYTNIPLKNLTIRPNNIITEIDTNAEGNYVVPVGYVPDTLTLSRLSKNEREFLQDHLEHNQTFLGVTGTNSSVVDTTEDLSGNSNHIIYGEPYWRNGVRYTGSLQQLDKYSIIDSSHGKVENSIIPTVEENTALIIPANSYTHEEIKFDISQLKAENIKNGVDIMGIVGNADIVDLYEGPVNIPIGTTSPILLPDENGDFVVEADTIELKNKRLDSNILLLPVANEYANDIVTGKSIGGLTGTFSKRSNGYISYITEDEDADGNTIEVETLIEATGTTIKHSESNDIAFDKYAFIEGRLVRGTNTSLVEQEEYTGDYLIELNDTTPPEVLETKDKLLTNNVEISINADKINSSKIAYGSTILGINGEYTHQETNPITASDVLSGKIGYVNGVEVTGNMPNYGDKSYSSSLKSQKNETAGYYKTLTINPITFTKNSVIHIYEESGGNTLIPSLIRKGWIVDGITGTGLMLHKATTATEITSLVASEEDNDVILYTGTSIANSFQTNNYYEIVKSAEEIAAGAYGAPTAARLIRERDLNEATTDTKNILSGIVVYGNKGEKLTGTMSNHGKFSATISPAIDYTTQKITSDKGYYDGIEIAINTSEIDSNTIKAGHSILGVTGTYTPTLDTLSIDVPDNDWTTDAQGYLTKTYTPSAGTDGWNQINIKTLIRSKDLGTITENGTHTFDVVNNDPGAHGWNQVSFTVGVAGPVLDTLNVTSNGTYNASDNGVDGWDTVTVDIHTVSGMPAIPIVKDYNLYMDGDNISWLHNSSIIFDDNDDLTVYYTAISGNSNFPLINIGDSIDMSNVKVDSVLLGTINLNPLYTNDTITQAPEKHIVAYFPAGEYCLPVWDSSPSFRSMAQSALWNLDCGFNATTHYSKLTTTNTEDSSLSCKISDNTGTPITLFSKTTGWTKACIQLHKPIIIPNDYYTATHCMPDLSLLLNPIKQYVLVPKQILITKDQGLNMGDAIIYESPKMEIPTSLILSSGDHIVLDVGVKPIAIIYSTTNDTITYNANSNEYIKIKVSSTGLSIKAYSPYPNSSVQLPLCKIIVV